MELVNELYDFFGFELLSESATIVDFLNAFFTVAIGVFIVCFIMRSIFMMVTLPSRRIF